MGRYLLLALAAVSGAAGTARRGGARATRHAGPTDWTWQQSVEDEASAPEEAEAVVLLQDVTGLSMLRDKVDERDDSSVEDSYSFAQNGVGVEAAPAVIPAPAAPIWKWGESLSMGEKQEEATCSAQGLTPGVCAMAALARAGPEGEQKAEGLDFLSPDRLERALFSEIESALAGTHAGVTAEQLAQLEQDLAGHFASMPKNSAGLLGPSATRYLMHERFLRRHGWYVRSLNPAGEAQTPASPGEALRARVPQHLQELIQSRQGGRGLGLRELAALVATLEHLVQGDMGERLKAAYAAQRLSTNGTVSEDEVAEALRTFMAHFLSLEHRSGYAISPAQAWKERRDLEEGYGGWRRVEDITAMAVTTGGAPRRMNFTEALAAAGEVMRRFTEYSIQECRGVKTALAAMPGGASGRVLLSDFHKEAVNGQAIFRETRDFLTKLGALDTTAPASPSVLVPNYILSPSNCVGTTSFFDMCCRNECEYILEDLEQSLRSPEAGAKEIADALAPRRGGGGLEPPLVKELEEAARAHGGKMSLHGLAFAQWLHAAFPLECPRPRPGDYGHSTTGKEADLPDAGVEFQAVADMKAWGSRPWSSRQSVEFQAWSSRRGVPGGGRHEGVGFEAVEFQAERGVPGVEFQAWSSRRWPT